MTRPVLFFVGLFATIALTILLGELLVPDVSVDPVFGLDVQPTATAADEGIGDDVGGSGPGEEPLPPAPPTPTPMPLPTTSPEPSATQTPVDGSLRLRPTSNWATVFSLQTTLDGLPIPVGAVVEAFDPDGTLAGRFTVVQEGFFGAMSVYADDPQTSVDEGAEPGDVITFMIDGQPAEVLGPDAPVWTGNSIQLNLQAGSAAP